MRLAIAAGNRRSGFDGVMNVDGSLNFRIRTLLFARSCSRRPRRAGSAPPTTGRSCAAEPCPFKEGSTGGLASIFQTSYARPTTA